MCIRILLRPQKTCRQITQWEMISPSMAASDVLWFVLSVFNTLLGFGTVATVYGGEYLVPVDRCRGENPT